MQFEIKQQPSFQTIPNEGSTYIFFLTRVLAQTFEPIPLIWRDVCKQKADITKFKGETNQILHVELFTQNKFIHVFLLGLGVEKKVSPRILRDQTGAVSRLCRQTKINVVSITLPTLSTLKNNVICQTVVEGMILGNYSFDTFKSKQGKKDEKAMNTIYLYTQDEKNEMLHKAIEKGIASSKSVCLARDLVNSPASHTHPETLEQNAFDIEKKSKGMITVEAFDEMECKKLGMEAYLGVAKGSDRRPVFIVLHYKHSKNNKGKKLVLIGKSVTFDSGGLSLKPSDAMATMKIDMAGGATILGIFNYLAYQQPETGFSEVIGILPACENMPSGRAMRPGDVVTAMNGKTIEVLNTDAEGRLTLADALSYAEKHEKADLIIDLATLTGACMVALGEDLSGLFSNSKKLTVAFSKSAEFAGDDYWELPLYSAYAKKIKSSVADIKNTGGGRYGGVITAALFLKEFVSRAQWMHVDIAGPAYREDKPAGIVPKGGTGWGVLSIIHFIESQHNL